MLAVVHIQKLPKEVKKILKFIYKNHLRGNKSIECLPAVWMVESSPPSRLHHTKDIKWY